jgi:hypothetical protein
MKHSPERGAPRNEHVVDSLNQLTAVPREALHRAIAHSKDVAESVIMTVEDSQIAIAWAVREAMERLDMSIYHLHELTGLECDFIDKIIEGSADISDSEPLSKLEVALGVRLNSL